MISAAFWRSSGSIQAVPWARSVRVICAVSSESTKSRRDAGAPSGALGYATSAPIIYAPSVAFLMIVCADSGEERRVLGLGSRQRGMCLRFAVGNTSSCLLYS